MFENAQRTEISSLGEFGLIDHLTKNFSLKNNTDKGVGDDAAVITPTEGTKTVVSTDLLVEGVHFDLSYFPMKHLGYKAVVVNLSDIFAMNAKPKQITVSLALSSRFSLEAIEELYQGISLACERYQVDLIGGDTSTSKQGLMISVTAIGEVLEKDIAYRSGAKANELLVVSGDLGGAYCGYQLLEREKRVFLDNPQAQPDLGGYDYIIERQLKPEARKDIIDILNTLDIHPTSMIDVSDGLASECFHLAKASDLGVTLYEEKIPIDPSTYNFARELDLDPTMCALSGGEDYELLFTIKQEDFQKLEHHPDFSIIGFMNEKNEGMHMMSKGGNKHPLQAQGWKAF
ncbi:MAG: thiamine-phosphate kinase [Bacteroidia bacterium]|nr:thiamine-phosphate kinase [Bacteroidia bacterium]MCF8427480.1 thiamine-phosphate kinase [Bacteroidia bacterium]